MRIPWTRTTRLAHRRRTALLAALLATPLSGQPLEATTAVGSSIETAIEDGRLEEALDRLIEAHDGSLGKTELERAADLFERTASRAVEEGDERLAVAALIAKAGAESELAHYRAARATLERAESLWRQDPDPATGIDLWNAHAFRLTYQGEAAAALEFRRRAVAQARAQGEPARLRGLLVSLGQNQLQLHDHAAAVASFQEALALDVEKSRRIDTWASLGIAHFELNQLDEAEEAFDRARRLAVEAGDRRREAWTIGELGIVSHRRHRDAARTLELFDRSIALFAELGDVRNEANFRLNRGAVLRDLGRYQDALRTSLEAEAQLARIEGQRPFPILTKNIADCLVGLGRPDEAEDRYRRAITEAAEDVHRRAHWQAAWGLARLLRRQGRAEEADAAFREALEVIEELRGSLRLESFKTDFFEDKIEVYASYVDFLVADGERQDRYARAFELAERARARAFLDTLAEARANLHETLPPGILEAEADLLGTIAEIQSRARDEGPSPESRRALEAAERRLEELYLRVRQELPRFRELRYPRPASLAEVQDALRSQEVLVEYFLAEPRSHLWVVTRDAVDWHELPPRAEIDRAARAVYGRLVDPSRPPQGLDELARWLLGPLEEAIAGASSLVIVPSGILHYLPLEVLPFAEAAARQPIPSPASSSLPPPGEAGASLTHLVATIYVPSASTLVELRRRGADAASAGVVSGAPETAGAGRVLAVGDPAYPPSTSAAATGVGQGRPAAAGLLLPHTRTEVERLAARFGRRRTTTLLGTEATEARFKSEPLESFTLVHLAAHGRIDTDHPERSGLLLADPPGGDQDGLLQMREIYRLPLAAELVTLSACRTAMGELVTGEGMVGLARAFQYAGAPTVVASLWSVSDEATAAFMESFYRHLARGESKAEALRRARVELAGTERYRHPYYWAPYVLIGEGADGVHFPGRGGWTAMLGAALVATAVLLGLALLARRRRPHRSRL